jgi:hypothetical protein
MEYEGLSLDKALSEAPRPVAKLPLNFYNSGDKIRENRMV